MPEEKQQQENKKEGVKEEKKDTGQAAAKVVAKSVYGEKKRVQRGVRRGRRKDSGPDDGFEQRIVDLARVTRVMAGGKRMSFRVCIAIGDKKGKVAVALGKGADVATAITKAVNKAKKNLVEVSIVNETIPHEIFWKYGAGKVLLKPARRGKGVIAGGAVRIVLELSGIKNITSKILGTNNKVTNAKCAVEALGNLKRVEQKKEKPENKEENKSAETLK